MKLKSKLKAVLAAVTFAFAGAALADINPGNITTAGVQQGNGELFLSVWNPTVGGGTSYTRDLGINMSNFLPTGAVAPVDAVPGSGVDFAFGVAPTIGAGNVLTSGYTLTFGLDGTAAATTLATLLGTAGTVWSVIGSDNFGNDRMLFTSNNAAPNVNTTQLATATGNVISHLGGVNAIQTGGTTDFATENGSSTAVSPSIAYSGSTVFSSNIGTFPFSTVATIGSSLDFWFADQVGTPVVSQFAGGEWLLASNGTLSWSVEQVAAPIPEPGTWALAFAGLAMVGGIARRRTKA